ncbi:hypothetical protein HK097_009092 [Rhizophlyctis rosea]|uniref:Putative lipoate-protein ligase A n=1 Tax=Rhizophlyctis rosea TaxID=64517 RepID=A0AAD5X449_9FUNG|nr:hypothetical protein HK097_009092 [Rhizophlyctis rosea]
MTLRVPSCRLTPHKLSCFGASRRLLLTEPTRKVECFISKVNDPWVNLAIEEWLFRRKDAAKYVLYLWRNTNCVVIGRNQNPWKECDLKLMSQDSIPLIRRRSGGGAVYHDIGNTNYTVIMPRDDFDRRKSASLISRALHHLDIPSSVNDRHDLVIGPNKISGSAYKIVSDRAYHHGTMLIDADLKALGRYLKPPVKNMVGKGVASVRSPVTRLREHSFTVDHLSFCESVLEEFGRTYEVPDLTLKELDLDLLSKHPDIKADHDELKTWNWTYGQTPEFVHQLDHQFAWGQVNAIFRVNHGIITEATITINAKDHVAVAMRLIEALEGQCYSPQGIQQAFDNLAVGTGMRLLDELAELKAWLLESI